MWFSFPHQYDLLGAPTGERGEAGDPEGEGLVCLPSDSAGRPHHTADLPREVPSRPGWAEDERAAAA